MPSPAVAFGRSVSIHAPGRGATDSSRTGECGALTFQFTHPGGVRQDAHLYELMPEEVSIHAPGRGATHRRRRSSLPS